MERSIFVFCGNYPASPCCGTIFKLDLNKEELELELVARFTHKTQSDPENYVGLDWSVCFTDKHKVCLLPKWPCLLGEYECLYGDGEAPNKFNKKELVRGYLYDIGTNKIEELNAPMCDNSTGLVLSLQEQIYWVDNPVSEGSKGGPSFQKYDKLTCTWEVLQPVPWRGVVTGYAVFDDFFVLCTCFEGLWIYDLSTKKWYLLGFEGEDYLFHGVGTGLENNTLYALKSDDGREGKLRRLCISATRGTENVVYTYSILPEIMLPFCGGLTGTDFLVHLDKNVFLLLRIADLFHYYGFQPLEVVRFEVVDDKISKFTSELTRIPERYGESFIPKYSFWLPASLSKDIMEKPKENITTLDLIRDTKIGTSTEEVQI
jgi:hypothetical protein